MTVGQLVLFSTETGDAWPLVPADQLAARLARDGDPEPIHIEENDTTFAIGWKGRYRIEGPAFIYVDHDTGQLSQPSLATRRISSNRPILKFQICLARIEATCFRQSEFRLGVVPLCGLKPHIVIARRAGGGRGPQLFVGRPH